jgi:hypothetical protein
MSFLISSRFVIRHSSTIKSEENEEIIPLADDSQFLDPEVNLVSRSTTPASSRSGGFKRSFADSSFDKEVIEIMRENTKILKDCKEKGNGYL